MMFRKYLSAYILPIFKKANIIIITNINRNIITLITIGIGKNNIPAEAMPNIKYNICLNDRYPPKNFFFMCKIKWYFI